MTFWLKKLHWFRVTYSVQWLHFLRCFRSLVQDFFVPVLKKQEKWGRLSNELRDELIKRVTRFGVTLHEAAESLANGVELNKPDPKHLEKICMSLQSFKDAADQPGLAAEFEKVLVSWVHQVCIVSITANRYPQMEDND